MACVRKSQLETSKKWQKKCSKSAETLKKVPENWKHCSKVAINFDIALKILKYVLFFTKELDLRWSHGLKILYIKAILIQTISIVT